MAMVQRPLQKKGDSIGYSGHKRMKGDKVVAICDRHCHVIASFVSAPGNNNESSMLEGALKSLKHVAKAVELTLTGTVMSLDGAYDSKVNRKMIFSAGMISKINESKRNRKDSK